MVAQFASGSNTFVPNFEASGKLVVGFSRNISKFKLNQYVQIVPVEQVTGFYLNLTAEEAGRLINDDGTDFRWPDGAEAPRGEDGVESFEFKPYRCHRYAYNVTLGDLAVQQAAWAINDAHLAIKAQQAMTARTLEAVTALTTSGNYDSSHRSAAASISGASGTWAASTTARQDIKRSLNYMAEKIQTDTLGAVDVEDLILVLGPKEAQALSLSQEFVDHVKGTPDSYAQFKGELAGANTQYYGMPDKIYGYKVVVESAVRTTSRKGATPVRSRVWPSATAVMVSRPGGLVGTAGAPSFSTASMFIYSKDDMSVETKHDEDNRLTKARIVDNRTTVLTAPAAGFLVTSIF